MGGLLDSLYSISCLVIYPIAQITLKTKLLSQLFRYRGSQFGLLLRMNSSWRLWKTTMRDKSNASETDNIVQSIRREFQNMKPISKINCCRQTFCCLKNYKKMLLKSQSALNKELDLRKFIYRQRLQTTAILGLLNGR